MKLPILFIVGPTASGKTKLSIELAKKCDAEIISADSRQIYKFMTIGTAKPSENEMSGIPHHFIDELNPDRNFSAGDFQKQAYDRIKNILSHNKNAIITGGSGLYISALRDGIADIPKDDETRDKIIKRLEIEGSKKLFEELKSVDAKAAETMDETKTQRLVRALEVFHFTGRPISEWQSDESYQFDFPNLTIGLNCDREILYDRINRRVDQMIADGLENEVLNLKSLGYNRKMNALRTVGYDEMFDYMEYQISKPQMVEKIKQHSRNYAKRQLTWFRKDPKITWLDSLDENLIEQAEKMWKGN